MSRGRERGEEGGPRVALIAKKGKAWLAEPLFERGGQVALDRRGIKVEPGRMALVDFGRNSAKSLRQLGSPKVAREVVEAVLFDRLGRRGFSSKVESGAVDAAKSADGGERRDLRDLPTFTVDPATARDFDDAVSAREEDGGAIRLWIHIADVAAHVRPGSELDREAMRRATSVYVPGFVEPMLPLALSGDACSLAPGVERLAVTTEVVLGADGNVGKPTFYRSRVRSDARLDYDHLDRVFAGRETPPKAAVEPLRLAREAAATLAKRKRPGALAVDSREPEFDFGDDGSVSAARSVEQSEAHRLIERLMVLTNELVAEFCERRKSKTIYRVHEQPEPERIERLVEQLAALGVPTPALPKRGKLSPSDAGKLAGEASRLVAKEAKRRGHGREAYTSLVLRSMKQAVYSERNLGHAGLGSPAYAHFTSPIRRYPDLVAHRSLLSELGAGEQAPTREFARDVAVAASEREREAGKMEHQADDICAAFLLERELFDAGPQQEFEGEVSGLVGAGAFVRFAGELADVYEGFLPARTMAGDRYDLDQTETALVGKRTGKRYAFGDPVTVRVTGIEKARGRVDLEPGGKR